MIKYIIISLFIVVNVLAYAQEDTTSGRYLKPKVHLHLTLQVDPFFGFLPIAGAVIKTRPWFGYTVYGKIWTSSHFASKVQYELQDINGNPKEVTVYTNDGSLTEIGGGVNFWLLNQKLSIRPQLGITQGSLFSGGNPGPFDGVVPNIITTFQSKRFDIYQNVTLFFHLREKGSEFKDVGHLVFLGGYKFNKYLSAGVYWDYLWEMFNSKRSPYPGDIVHWIGPYGQVTLPNGAYFRYTAGWNIGDKNSTFFFKPQEFYKVTFFFPFNIE